MTRRTRIKSRRAATRSSLESQQATQRAASHDLGVMRAVLLSSSPLEAIAKHRDDARCSDLMTRELTALSKALGIGQTKERK